MRMRLSSRRGTAASKGGGRPGQARGKHARLSNWAPPQDPPGTASLRTSLCRNREPRPQETLQELHAVQEDMMQSTAGGGETRTCLSVPRTVFSGL